MSDGEKLDRIILLLESIAAKLGARLPGPQSPPTSAEEIRRWREVNRARRGEDDGGEYPSSTTTREAFYRKRGV